MVGDVETHNSEIISSNDEDIKNLENDFKILQEKTQDLINERAHMESEIRNLKKRANRLDEEVRYSERIAGLKLANRSNSDLNPNKALSGLN